MRQVPCLYGHLAHSARDRLPDRVADNRSEFLRCCPSRVAQIDFVVETAVRKILGISLLRKEVIHPAYCFRLVVVAAGMHALHAQAFVPGEKFGFGKIALFFGRRFCSGPVKFFFCDKFRQADKRNPGEVFFMGIVNAVRAFLLPVAERHRRNSRRCCGCLYSSF